MGDEEEVVPPDHQQLKPPSSASAAADDMDMHKQPPSWFTPKRLLVIFCVINMINYIDRGAIASNGINGSPRVCATKTGVCSHGTGIQGDFDLSNFKDGVISSAFMVGLLVASPIFASLAKSINPFRLIGVGLSVWTFAVAGCGISIDFWSITICRMLVGVGVGEASFISLAAPFIDDNAPVTQRTAWLGIFYMCIPTGIALGYVYGGWVGDAFGWRYAFFGFSPAGSKSSLKTPETNDIEVEVIKTDKDVQVLNQNSNKPSSSGLVRFWEDIKALLHEKISKKYLLAGSPSATFTVVSRKVRALTNATSAENLMVQLREMLKLKKANIETSKVNTDQGKASTEANMVEQRKTQTLVKLQQNFEGTVTQIKSCLKDLSVQIYQGKTNTSDIISKLRDIEVLLRKDLPTSKRKKLIACYSSLRAEADTVVKEIIDCMMIQQSRLNECFHKLATTSLLPN